MKITDRAQSGDPTVATAKFESTIEMIDEVPQVTWTPDLGADRVYRVLGAKSLSAPVAEETAERSETAEGRDGTVWELVTEETKGDFNFFKVSVEMP